MFFQEGLKLSVRPTDVPADRFPSVRQIWHIFLTYVMRWVFGMCFLYFLAPKGKGKAPEGCHFASTYNNTQFGIQKAQWNNHSISRPFTKKIEIKKEGIFLLQSLLWGMCNCKIPKGFAIFNTIRNPLPRRFIPAKGLPAHSLASKRAMLPMHISVLCSMLPNRKSLGSFFFSFCLGSNSQCSQTFFFAI